MGIKSIAGFVVAGCMTFTIAGCGESKPPTFPVTGVVTLDGKPLPEAIVTFVGDPPESSASTRTDAEGKYALSTYSAGDGALPGSYKIMVTKVKRGAEVSPYDAPAEEAAPVEQTADAISAAYSQAYKGPPKGGWKAPKTENEVPVKYTSVATSGLTFAVDKKPNTYDIELKSK